ncbi:MAG: HAMP domain-containing histidine kinase, partial [Clostridiales bacterium]|nr:HAMP domain-containing histidine kinase [Clostridiales bacterium]
MLRRLKIKIVAVALGTFFLVFAAVLLVLNLSAYQSSVSRAEDFMASVAENDGFAFPPRGASGARWDGGGRVGIGSGGQGGGAQGDYSGPGAGGLSAGNPGAGGPSSGGRGAPGGPEAARAGRFFYAKLDEAGAAFELNLDMMFDFTPDDAQSLIEGAVASKKARGGIGNFLFMAAGKPYGQMLVFAERSIEMGLLDHLTRTSIWAAGIVCAVLSCLAAFLAKWIVAPVKAAFDKQRRFISDASHELKTPLTIIGANVDVLQNEIGDNRRLAHIKAQSERMNGLVRDLLALAKADEGQGGAAVCEFDLSSAVLNTALEFESRAFEEGKRYSCDIGEGLAYAGDEGQIKQLVGIFIDNAIRYSGANGQISVTLRQEGGRPCVSVFNTGVGVSVGERDKVFERFYRSDESRSRETGGYGVGLSIAKSIADAHKAKIAVSGEHGKWVR